MIRESSKEESILSLNCFLDNRYCILFLKFLLDTWYNILFLFYKGGEYIINGHFCL